MNLFGSILCEHIMKANSAIKSISNLVLCIDLEIRPNVMESPPILLCFFTLPPYFFKIPLPYFLVSAGIAVDRIEWMTMMHHQKK